MGEFKRAFKQMCVQGNYGINPNQQVTTNRPQANAIMERVHKVVNDMLRSFDLENNPFDYFLQSTAWIPCY
jgi:hypothetical protein